jgi:WD40-like Beta Propeller Repeat
MIPASKPRVAMFFHLAIALSTFTLLSPLLIAAPQDKPKPPKEVKIEKVDEARISASDRQATPSGASPSSSGSFIGTTSKYIPAAAAEPELSMEGGSASLVNPVTGLSIVSYELPVSAPSTAKPRVMTSSPDDKWVAIYYHSRKYPNILYDTVQLYKTRDKRPVGGTMDSNVYTDMQFSPDSSLLAFTSRLDVGKPTLRVIVEVWGVSTQKKLISIEPPRDFRTISAVAISPDNTMIALAGSLRFGLFPLSLEGMEDPDTPQKLNPIPGSETIHYDLTEKGESLKSYDINAITFSADGKCIFTVGEDKKRIKWRVTRIN